MYQKQKNGIWKHMDFIIIDIIVLEVSFLIAYFIRHGMNNPYLSEKYLVMGVILGMIQLIIVSGNENYKGIIQRGYLIELQSVIIQNTLVMLFSFAFMFLTKQQDLYSRMVFIYTWIISIVFMYAARMLWKYYIRKRIKENMEQVRMLVVCDKANMKENIIRLQAERFQSFQITGAVVYDKDFKGRWIEKIPVVSNKEKLFEYVRKEVIDEVFLDITGEKKQIQKIVERFLEMGIIVHLGLGWQSGMLPNQMIEDMGDCSVLTTSIKTASNYQLFVKRLMDLAGSIVGLILTGIIYLFIAPIIRKQSPGPVFFSQVRVGKNGRRFRIYKFRSMYMDAEERKKDLIDQNKMSGFMFKIDDDPRITPIGKFLRKYSLDEFPQFWNVFRGDMSLVGTRPPTVDEVEQYEDHHKIRLSIKPGLTGMWQVSGRSDITDFEEVVRLDNKYIAEWNIRLDLKILLKTVGVVFKSKGSV